MSAKIKKNKIIIVDDKKVKKNKKIKKLKMIDLCAGTGAFTYAFESTKLVDVVFANDLEASSKLIYDANFNHNLTLGNICDIDVKDIPAHDIITAGFPCFIKGTNVLTVDGYQKIEDVNLCDKLITHTGNSQKINNIQEKEYCDTLYNIKIEQHSNTITCTKEHPFYVRQRVKKLDNDVDQYVFNEPEWIPANKLTSDHYFGMVINNKSIVPESIIKSEQWYSVGYQIGNQYIPEWIHDAPTYLIQIFLDGFVRANGFINDDKSHEMNVKSYNLAMDIQRLYLKLGLIYSVVECTEYYEYSTYRIFNNTEKKQSAFIEDNYVWYKSQDISNHELDESIKVYNFEVDIDNSYIVENAIVHNCQPFSIAGKREGFEDPRSNVFWKILEIAKHHKPECIILENVKNLLTHDNGDTFKTIEKSLKKEKYSIIHKILNTSDITKIPHHRERLYIVCVKDKKLFDDFNLDFPQIKKGAISTMLITGNAEDKYYYDKVETNKIHKMVTEAVLSEDTVYQFRRKYVRENKNNECPTLTANMGTGGHNVPIILDDKGARKLIPRECFNFQGFPKKYKLPKLSDSKLYKLSGNAVSVPVVELIANKLVPKLHNKLK